ncbi:site-specific DNA-methyltransferase [Mycoplasma bradburyae]|uniref:site-specific DNA-methyltransferase n=1 Tax=Mycoplasma bradburyae TaxID=2963128 RepID=UPI0020CEA74D|nr:site-specific DNA-methyltransferase [Mycoplasma bradburyae]UTS70062.1 site-specific DNA-methyltransferase [Mycoplasma bradburyae]
MRWNLWFSSKIRERERESNNYLYDVIYIDPPYNTEHAAKDGNGIADDKENKENKKFIYRDKFSRNGWLNMMQERLVLARKLLKEDGVIFVSIDDNEQAYLKVLMDDIFGEENFVATIIFNKTSQGRTLGTGFKRTHEFIHCYSKSIKNFELNLEKYGNIDKYKLEDEFSKYTITNKLNSINSYLEDNKKRGYTIYWNEKTQDAKVLYEYDFNTLEYSESYNQDLINKGYIPIRPGLRKNNKTVWNWSEETFLSKYKTEIVFKKDSEGKVFPFIKNRIKDKTNPFTIQVFDSRKTGIGILTDVLDHNEFEFAKPMDLIKWIVDRHPNKNARVLDFFAGSGTTAHAVMQLNREDDGNRTFTLVTNNENDIGYEITYERIYRISQGKGTNGNTFKWLSENKPYNIGFSLYDVKQMDLSISNKNNIKEFESNVVKMLMDFEIEKPEEIELIKLRALKTISSK